MPKCRWLKGIMGREVGHVEDNQEDLIAAWEKAGYVEKVAEEIVTTKELKDKDYEERCKPVQSPGEKAVFEPPVDKAIKPANVKKK